jgi:CxxC-x17-CxxC domain-containing protein
MDVQFVDRILVCSDCHSEFVFTAGEQLFFHDKQFKNDPKRCKPCKSRRSGLSAGANSTGPAAAGLSRTETRTECSECGVPTTVPFKPTQGRPVLCRQCFQAKGKAAAAPATAVPSPIPTSLPTMIPSVFANDTASTLTLASAESSGAMMSVESAVGAAASMASASPNSSVASAADLASITESEAALPKVSAAQIPTELLAAASSDSVAPEQMAARVEASEA